MAPQCRGESEDSAVINLFSVVLIGFVLGMRHATDADHVIAVSTIVSRERRISSAVLVGALWGIGHSITIFLVGSAIILFDVVIPPRLGLSMEFSVAVMLILLGAFNLSALRKSLADTSPAAPHPTPLFHTHVHGDGVLLHAHHLESPAHHHTGDEPLAIRIPVALRRLGLFSSLRPLIVGIVHGLAGSAAIALLVLTTIPSPLWGLAYLLVFGLGTVAGMMLITVANGMPFTLTAGRFTLVNRYLGFATGLLSLGFGLFLAYQIGVLNGLFSSQPTWTPG
jgi:high-affinity nickel-transport protein